MKENIVQFFLILVGLLGAGGFIYALISRSEYLVKKWAHENGYQLLLSDPRIFCKGPFFWSGRTQTVYRVVIRDEQGETRTGWVRLGDFWRGVFVDQVQVKWDDKEYLLGKQV